MKMSPLPPKERSKKEHYERVLRNSDLKTWIHSLTVQQLLDAMKFAIQRHPDSSSSSSSSCHEYDLLIEMLSNQSPPPIPIHPKGLGYKRQASNKPITNGRWDEEERILRNRFERPRLFQFIERSPHASVSSSISNSRFGGGGIDDILDGYDVTSLGIPTEIAELIKAEKKVKSNNPSSTTNATTSSTTTTKKARKAKRGKQHRYFDVLAKKFVQPWGDIYSLGCTERQRVFDACIFAGTRIHYGCAKAISANNTDVQCHKSNISFEPDIEFSVGTTLVTKKFGGTKDILTMLQIASRGRFLSLSFDKARYDNLEQVPFCAPWFDPTKEWFSLPMYLASRYEVALWHSFQLKITSKSQNESIPKTIIEKHSDSMPRALFDDSILKAIYHAVKGDLLKEVDAIDHNFSDLIMFHLLQHPFQCCCTGRVNLDALISVRLFDIGSSVDRFRLSVVRNLEEILSEEIGKSLFESFPTGCGSIHKDKSTKRTSRKKKKNRRHKAHISSSHPNHLKAIDEDQDEGTKTTNESENELSPLEQSSYLTNVPNKTLNNSKMFVLEIIDSILIDTFQQVGFESYDNDEEGKFLNKVKCHDFEEMPQRKNKVTYVLKKQTKPKVIQDQSDKETNANTCACNVENEDNQMTMKRSNLSWDKAVTQPAFTNQQSINDFFRTHTFQESEFPEPILDTVYSSTWFRNGVSRSDIHQQYSEYSNFIDCAFDRIEKNIINDLLDGEQRLEEMYASSTAASIASSRLDFENDQVSNDDDLFNENDEENEKVFIKDALKIEDEGIRNPIEDKLNSFDYEDPDQSSLKQTSDIKITLSLTPDKQDPPIPAEESYTIESPTPQEPKTPPPQLSPILVNLAELGDFRKRTHKGNDEEEDKGDDSYTQPSAQFSSLPSSPKFPKRCWSREDLRIPVIKDDDSHDFQNAPSSKSYKNAALKGFKRTPSLCSHDFERNVTQKRLSGSNKFAKSASSLKSSGQEVIIDASIQLNMCAQSESALDNHEDSSHWNVMPIAGLDETDNATLTKDGATTISSFPSIQETEEVTCLREERNAYRDMCLTLGSEIAKLKNLLAANFREGAIQTLPNNHFMRKPSYSKSSELVPWSKSSYDPEYMPPFYHQNQQKGMPESKFTARSDAGIHNETIMSEERAEITHDSVIATDASGKHRTVNSNSICNVRLSSLSEGRAGSDVASTDYETGRSVFNPPTSTCFFRRDSVGPAHLHGLQSRLGQEISDFTSTVSLQLEKRCNTRELARKRLTTLVTTIWPRAQVKIYGSHVTGLCLPSSDLDFVICLPAVHKNTPADTPGDLEGRNAINETNQKLLARKLKSESWIDPRSIKLIERTIVPVIKVATKDIRSKSLQLDISFQSQDHHGLNAIDMVNETISHYPMARPLVLVLKQFLLEKGLLTAYTGGLSSYCLFLMVTKYLQEYPLGWSDSGVYLMGFLDFYGNHFDPRTTGISVRKEKYFARPHNPQNYSTNWTAKEGECVLNSVVKENASQIQLQMNSRSSILLNPSRPFSFDPLFVEDPISHGNNVGRNSFRINQVQRAFSDAHRTLVASLEWDMNSAEDLGHSHLLRFLIQGVDL